MFNHEESIAYPICFDFLPIFSSFLSIFYHLPLILFSYLLLQAVFIMVFHYILDVALNILLFYFEFHILPFYSNFSIINSENLHACLLSTWWYRDGVPEIDEEAWKVCLRIHLMVMRIFFPNRSDVVYPEPPNQYQYQYSYGADNPNLHESGHLTLGFSSL